MSSFNRKQLVVCCTSRRTTCLKYLVLANMLMKSGINPFDSQEVITVSWFYHFTISYKLAKASRLLYNVIAGKAVQE